MTAVQGEPEERRGVGEGRDSVEGGDTLERAHSSTDREDKTEGDVKSKWGTRGGGGGVSNDGGGGGWSLVYHMDWFFDREGGRIQVVLLRY
jgi:hypothetical protein